MTQEVRKIKSPIELLITPIGKLVELVLDKSTKSKKQKSLVVASSYFVINIKVI